ncbi:HAD family hydrolase [Phenylobacterium aquaticum]|uniref:D-glycero-alpha-D-manno-heptose-1,7-bisphosphate 7-phosphatase n=1 Tax=Phenylobacterium aquaticum TaxID=1763816 RepID=UPI0026F28394|nr:HAD family hydrolase [Phenylobacterium aquaticum]
MSLRPAIFLDRDGVLNEIVERDGKPASPRTPQELAVVAEAPDALAALRDMGFALFVVTNQPDVRRGLMTDAALDAIHAKLTSILKVEEVAACRHDNADACACRKPKPGLILDLAARHGIDVSRSWMIGDQDRDVACGQAAGCATLLLSRPYNSGANAGATGTIESLSQAIPVIAKTCAPALMNGTRRVY